MIKTGTKHIDPDTGLIYFKYDFGYEFGIVLPGEGKTMGKTTTDSSKKTIQGQRRSSDIEMPIAHEFTERKANGFLKKDSLSNRQSKPENKFRISKTVKWEPTSESEYSEIEETRNSIKKQSNNGSIDNFILPPSGLVISCSPSRWDRITPSPISLSPSLPSLSPKYSSATGPPSNVDSTGIANALLSIISQALVFFCFYCLFYFSSVFSRYCRIVS